MTHRLTKSEEAALAQVGSTGMRFAATALSQLVGRTVSLARPKVMTLPLGRVAEVVGGEEKAVVGLRVRFYGGSQGTILIVFPRETAFRLCYLLTGRDEAGVDALSELDASALKEVGNILASSFLTAAGRSSNLVFLPSVPTFALDMAGAVVDEFLIELGASEDTVVLIAAGFFEVGQGLAGQFFLIPHPSTLQAVIALGGKEAG